MVREFNLCITFVADYYFSVLNVIIPIFGSVLINSSDFISADTK